MKATRLFEIGDFRTIDIELRDLKNDEILIEVGACGICGSDLPRVFELGTSTKKYPLTLGHEFSGTVVKVNNSEDDNLIGERVAVFPCIPCQKCEMCEIGQYALCLDYDYLGSRSDGGFAEYCIVPNKFHLVKSNNPELSLDELSMTEPATVAQHTLRRAKLSAGENIVIIGAGPIGIMTAKWAKLFGANNIILLDVIDEKINDLRTKGYKVLNSLDKNLKKEINEILNGEPLRIVVEGTGTSSGLNIAIDLAHHMGNIALLGNPHKDTILKLENHSKILRKELNIFGVWNSYFAKNPLNEWKYTVEMLDEKKLILADLITHRVSLEELPEIFKKIYNNEINTQKVIFTKNNEKKDNL